MSDTLTFRPERPTLGLAPKRTAVMVEALPSGGFVLSKRSSRTMEVEPLRAVTTIEELFSELSEAFR